MLNLGVYNIVGSINTMVFGSNKFRIRRSQSKASYLAYRRERGAPDSEGSYKRTMSPTARLEDWQQQQQQQHSSGSREHDDPVLLRVTPHHSHQSHQLQQQQDQDQQQKQSSSHQHLHHHHSHNSHSDYHQQSNQQQLMDLPKSHSVDALHQRIEERNTFYSSEVMGKLSHELTKKLQATENRPRSESNNNNNTINNNDSPTAPRHGHQDKRQKYKERLSPQSIQVLNDRNRQLERERRKLAASCEPVSQSRLLSEASNDGIEDFYRERSATIEMTSRNVELLNRRNALVEKRINGIPSSSSSSSSSSSASPIKDHQNDESVPNSNSITRIQDKDEIRNVEVEKPPAPVSSPPRTPDSEIVRSQESLASSQSALGAIPRRSGSCSSSSSNEPVSSFKSSPRKTQSFGNDSSSGKNDAIESFSEEQGSETIISKCYTNSRRKVSSPSQTENSWMRSNSPRARSSQTEDPNASIELGRIFSSRSRSSSLSSASKISSSSCSSLGSASRFSPIENKTSPRVSPQPGIEGLTMVQRSEIVLRVNATTSDASSQTEVFHEDEGTDNKEAIDCQVFPEPRRKLQEEIECEELSRDLASRLGPNDKLVPILVPAPEHKKPTDYVSGLFRVEATLQPRPRRPPSLDTSNSIASVDTETDEDGKNETMHSTPTTPLSMNEPSSPLSATSAYFTTSEGKARFLTRYSRDVTEEDTSACSVNSPTVNATTSSNDSFHLRQKKEELVLRLDKKVVVLRAEQEAVREEGELNEALGARVATRVCAVARPAEASKYRLHVEEVGKITSLLLGLSGRLARAENALYGMPANHPERKILESKRDKLMDQLEEAKILKSNIDKRSVNVSAILAKYLNDDEYADYQHFINMKAKLIMDGREIQDKVKLGEEQLAALKEAIN